MALRRPPTRIELKTEDMAEYDELQQSLQAKRVAAGLETASSNAGAYASHSNAAATTAHDRIGLSSQNAVRYSHRDDGSGSGGGRWMG